MTGFIVFLAALGSALITLRIAASYRPETRVDHTMIARLRPFSGCQQSARYMDKEELWHELGGLRGVLALMIGAAAINELAARIAKKDPDARTAAQMVFFSMLELQALAAFLPFEAMACWLSPAFPRALAGTIVRLFCDLASIYSAAESIGSNA